MGRPNLPFAGAFALFLFGTASGQTDPCVHVSDAVFSGSDYSFVVEAQSCGATYAVLTIEFHARVVDATVDDADGETAYSGDTVVFVVPDLEDNPTEFTVVLDTCGEIEGTDIVAAWSYVDAEGNEPDETALGNTRVVPPICTTRLWPSVPTLELASTWEPFSGSFVMSYDWSYDWFYGDDTLNGEPRCSNGVVGLDGAFDTCCSIECGLCSVSDCFDYDDCCAAAIVAADVLCSVSGEAPCVKV